MLPVKVGVSPLNWENGQICSSAAAAAKGFLSAGGNRRANQEEASSELCLFVTERSVCPFRAAHRGVGSAASQRGSGGTSQASADGSC